MDELYNFYKNKKVIVTGHTGFKGSWLVHWLHKMGAEVYGISLDSKEGRELYQTSNVRSLMKKEAFIDIGVQKEKLKLFFNEIEPDMVFHLAAQSLVLSSYVDPVGTYQTNVIGTINVLEAIRETKSIKSSIIITTDKCYENKEQYWSYRENDAFGGYDPYSSSKGCCEILISSWRRSFNMKNMASARAGNVIGGGDFAKNRIVPDWYRSFKNSTTLKLRKPNSIRPWQHVLEPLYGYLLLGMKLFTDDKYSGGWNFGPTTNEFHTVKDVITGFDKFHCKSVNIEYENIDTPHEANLLQLDITKAQIELGWKPVFDFEKMIELTAKWYVNYNAGKYAEPMCLNDIETFEDILCK